MVQKRTAREQERHNVELCRRRNRMLKRRMRGRLYLLAGTLYLQYESMSIMKKRCLRILHRAIFVMVLLPLI